MVASRNISQGNFCGLCWYFCLGKPQILQPGSTQFPAADMVKSSMQDEKIVHGLGLVSLERTGSIPLFFAPLILRLRSTVLCASMCMCSASKHIGNGWEAGNLDQDPTAITEVWHQVLMPMAKKHHVL